MSSVEESSRSGAWFIPPEEDSAKSVPFTAGEESHRLSKENLPPEAARAAKVGENTIPTNSPARKTWEPSNKATPILPESADSFASTASKVSREYASSLDEAATPVLPRKSPSPPQGPAPTPPGKQAGTKGRPPPPPSRPAPTAPTRPGAFEDADTPPISRKAKGPSSPSPKPFEDADTPPIRRKAEGSTARNQGFEEAKTPPISRLRDPTATFESLCKQEGRWCETEDAVMSVLQAPRQYVVLQSTQQENMYVIGVKRDGVIKFVDVDKQEFLKLVSDLGRDEKKIGDAIREISKTFLERLDAISAGGSDIDRLQIAYDDQYIRSSVENAEFPTRKEDSLKIVATILNVPNLTDESAIKDGRKPLVKQIHSDKGANRDDLMKFWNALWANSGMK